jgi:hypothetical protein
VADYANSDEGGTDEASGKDDMQKSSDKWSPHCVDDYAIDSFQLGMIFETSKNRNIKSTSDEAYTCTRLFECSEFDSIFLRSLSAMLRTATCLQALYHVGEKVILWVVLLWDTLIAIRKMGVCVAFAIPL